MDRCEKVKRYLRPIGLKLAFCCCLYSMVMVADLVNCRDGLWNGPYYQAAHWELSLGRWTILYWDRLLLGIHTNPWATLVTLSLFILGTSLLVDILGILPGSWQDHLVSMLFLSNMIVCISVSYLYTSGIYGLAFFLSMLCVKCVLWSMEDKRAVFAGALCLALVMGLYQSYLGCITLMALAALLLMIQEGRRPNEIGRYLRLGILTGIAGFCLYEVIQHVHMMVFHVSMSAYNGADDISLRTIITNLIPSVRRAYEIFWRYLMGMDHHWNALPSILLRGISIAAITGVVGTGIIALWRGKEKGQRSRLFFWGVCIALTPLAVNVVFLLAPKSAFLEQQTAPLALVVAVIVAMLARRASARVSDRKSLLWGLARKDMAVVVLGLSLLFGNVSQILIDQEAMAEGMHASRSIGESVFQTLVQEGLYGREATYALIGAPCASPLFFATPLYDKANSYAKFGGPWWDGSELDNRAWYGLFHYRLGLELPMCDAGRYEELARSAAVREMPVYPAEGSIQEIEGVIVIKVS